MLDKWNPIGSTLPCALPSTGCKALGTRLKDCVVKDIGDYANSNAIGLPNDSISSVRVGSNAQAIVCKDNDFKGDCILLTRDVSFLNNGRVGNDQISSVKVQQLGTSVCPPGNNQVSSSPTRAFSATAWSRISASMPARGPSDCPTIRSPRC